MIGDCRFKDVFFNHQLSIDNPQSKNPPPKSPLRGIDKILIILYREFKQQPYPGHPCPERGCVNRKTAGQGCPGYNHFYRRLLCNIEKEVGQQHLLPPTGK
jgi:hypothetical protein